MLIRTHVGVSLDGFGATPAGIPTWDAMPTFGLRIDRSPAADLRGGGGGDRPSDRSGDSVRADLPEEYSAALEEEGVPADFVWLVNYLFTTVLDGRGAHLTDGVQRVLGRDPRDFADYARETAAAGVWDG